MQQKLAISILEWWGVEELNDNLDVEPDFISLAKEVIQNTPVDVRRVPVGSTHYHVGEDLFIRDNYTCFKDDEWVKYDGSLVDYLVIRIEQKLSVFDINDVIIQQWSTKPKSQWAVDNVKGVRVTHLPTEIVIICEEFNSQFKNRNKAIKMLKERVS